MSDRRCPFCEMPPERVVAANALALAVRDLYPVAVGHSLVIPRRHVSNWWSASREEQAAINDLLDVVKTELDRDVRPDGYNLGINDGVAAGQTVFHLHVHLIPRHFGDVPDPRGGVRYVIPGRAKYLP